MTLTLLSLLAEIGTSAAQERWKWSGSLATNAHGYMQTLNKADRVGLNTFTLEAAQKVSVNLSERVAINVKTCLSCHGFRVSQAYAEVSASDLVNVEIGRFIVPFGEFNSRHDPANNKTASKPLPYMMGHIVRPLDHNYSILMTPYADTGLNLFGNYWPNDNVQLSYALYLVNGLQGTNDINWVQSAEYRDNNPFPVGGARMVIAPYDLFIIGGSFLTGTYDDDSDLGYWIAGAELRTRVKRFTVRGEYLRRKTQVYIPVPGGGVIRDSFAKSGFYAEIEFPVQSHLEFIARVDGMLRKGPVVGQALDESMGITRLTAGITVVARSYLMIKVNHEFWRLTDFKDLNLVNLQVVLTY
ncbi:MAG: hypothetical protein HY710_04185 [Candidatus Latescibacteria bacterium]|nr:hypothetical protein [Candidatus Latescibacterota bacterium]